MQPARQGPKARAAARSPQMKSPAWGRGAYLNGAGGDWGARRRGVKFLIGNERGQLYVGVRCFV